MHIFLIERYLILMTTEYIHFIIFSVCDAMFWIIRLISYVHNSKKKQNIYNILALHHWMLIRSIFVIKQSNTYRSLLLYLLDTFVKYY